MVAESWRRGFTRLPATLIVLGLFFPFLAWTPLVKFQPGLGDDGGDLTLFQVMNLFN